VYCALKSGELIKQPCEICGDSKSEGHHEDYDKPLDVTWLCDAHHKARHRELNSANRRGEEPQSIEDFINYNKFPESA
jgi:hypothetical protein